MLLMNNALIFTQMIGETDMGTFNFYKLDFLKDVDVMVLLVTCGTAGLQLRAKHCTLVFSYVARKK